MPSKIVLPSEKIEDEKTLDGYFGDKWKPVLKKIIEKKLKFIKEKICHHLIQAHV